jgi:hypothetical protein
MAGTIFFEQKDIQQFFEKFGKVENVIIKQNNAKMFADDLRLKEQESIAYIIYPEYFSAVLALKVINSEKERIVKAQICSRVAPSSLDKPTTEPLLYSYPVEEMVLEVEQGGDFGGIANEYKYVGTIGLDLTDRNFRTKERILGVDGCNFVRIYYLCDKSFKF